LIEVEGEHHELAAGDGLEVAPGQWHQVMNEGEEDAWFINLSSPSAHGDRVNEGSE
jgi:quercetin dioxygenase-like cupin family protein